MKIKKILSAILVVLTAVIVVPMTANAETEGDYSYTIENGEATVTEVDTSVEGTVIIPDELGGYPVTAIGDWAFEYCTEVTGVTIPDSVTSIGDRAFYYCPKLTSVTIGNGVETIGEWAFSNCGGLTSIHIPANVTSIGEGAFSDCGALEGFTVDAANKSYYFKDDCLINTETNELVKGFSTSIIPADGSVTSIGNYAFYGCGKLTTVTIPDCVTSIGDSAFFGCTGLTDVTIGTGVNNIGDSAFYSCWNLTDIVIPDGVERIEAGAFAWCSKLEDITLPNSVRWIGEQAFNNCVALTSITLPDSIESIGINAFYYCTGLTSLVLPNSITYISESAFEGCSNLVLTVYPDSYASQYVALNELRYHISVEAEDIPPTCTEDGLTGKTYCSICNEILNPGEVVPATGHTPGKWIIEKEPTDSAEGLRIQKCTECGAELAREVIPADNTGSSQSGDNTDSSQSGDNTDNSQSGGNTDSSQKGDNSDRLQSGDDINNPETGDGANIRLWVSLIFFSSGLSIAGVIVTLKRKEKAR